MARIKQTLKKYRIFRNCIPIVKLLYETIAFELRRVVWLRKRRHIIDRYLESNNVKKLHLGCGTIVMNGWLNTDLNPRSGDIAFLDIEEPLPFPNDSFEYIYSEHLIEHIALEKAIFHLAECRRVLKKGGKLRIATPNLLFLIKYFVHSGKSAVEEKYLKKIIDEYYPQLGFHHEAILINHFFRHWGHKFIFDPTTLSWALQSAGFSEVRETQIYISDDPNLRGLERHGEAISREFNELQTMVFEAVK